MSKDGDNTAVGTYLTKRTGETKIKEHVGNTITDWHIANSKEERSITLAASSKSCFSRLILAKRDPISLLLDLDNSSARAFAAANSRLTLSTSSRWLWIISNNSHDEHSVNDYKSWKFTEFLVPLSSCNHFFFSTNK